MGNNEEQINAIMEGDLSQWDDLCGLFQELLRDENHSLHPHFLGIQEAAVACLRNNATPGDRVKAYYRIGVLFYLKEDYHTARRYLEYAVTEGHMWFARRMRSEAEPREYCAAMILRARMYLTGKGSRDGRPNCRDGLMLYNHVIDRNPPDAGAADAMVSLANWYLEEEPFDANNNPQAIPYHQIIYLYEKANSLGHPTALMLRTRMYDQNRSQGRDRNYATALGLLSNDDMWLLLIENAPLSAQTIKLFEQNIGIVITKLGTLGLNDLNHILENSPHIYDLLEGTESLQIVKKMASELEAQEKRRAEEARINEIQHLLAQMRPELKRLQQCLKAQSNTPPSFLFVERSSCDTPSDETDKHYSTHCQRKILG